MADITVTFTGGAELITKLEELKAAAIEAYKQGMVDFGKEAQKYARDKAHEQSGRLRGGMELLPGTLHFDLLNRTQRLRYPGKRTYAYHQEMGTSKMSPRPYMRPTVLWAQGVMPEYLAARVRAVLS
jgi:hypothetical protein